jgi:glycerol uptake facilitator-like aquaporin
MFLVGFVFVLIILTVTGRNDISSQFIPILIGLGLIVGIFITQGLVTNSYAHLNPAVTGVMKLNGSVNSWDDFIYLIFAQFLGGILAFLLYKTLNYKN